MTMGVFDFKAINRKLTCNEQKADFDAKNPKVDPNKVVWSPEWGYGMAAPYCEAMDLALLTEAYKRAYPIVVVGDETGG